MLTKLFERKKLRCTITITGIIFGGDIRLGDNSDRDTGIAYERQTIV